MLERYRARLLQEAHRNDIRKYLTDPEFAAAEARAKRHGAIGEWLEVEEGKRVLEVGCGPGKYVAMLSALGFNVVGIDPHEFEEWHMIRDAYPVELMAGVTAEELPFDDQSFDHICCFGTLLYLEDPKRSLNEMCRVLRPGGRIAIRTVNSSNNYTRRTGCRLDPASRNLYTMEELQTLVETASFKVQKKFAYGYWPSRSTNLYWFLQAVVFGPFLVDLLDRHLLPKYKHNNIIHAYRPQSPQPNART